MPATTYSEIQLKAAAQSGTKNIRWLLGLSLTCMLSASGLTLFIFTAKGTEQTAFALPAALCFMLFSLGLQSYLQQLMTRKAGLLQGFCQQLSSGVTSARIRTSASLPEFRALNEVARYQTGLEARLSGAASEIGFTALELDKVARELVQGASDQQLQLDSIAAATEETSQTVQEIGRAIGRSLSSANALRQMSDRGEEDAAQLEHDLQSCQAIFADAQAAMQKLREQTAVIAGFITTIDDVANQTNLLALNAAIEAARAGESGRGFAVVADEVRGLASQTSAASQQITRLIAGTHEAVDTTRQAFERCDQRLQDGVQKGKVLREAMTEVAGFSSEIEAMIAQVEEASREHEAASESINQRMVAISDINAHHHLKVCDALEIVEYLEQVSDRLQTHSDTGTSAMAADRTDAAIPFSGQAGLSGSGLPENASASLALASSKTHAASKGHAASVPVSPDSTQPRSGFVLNGLTLGGSLS